MVGVQGVWPSKDDRWPWGKVVEWEGVTSSCRVSDARGGGGGGVGAEGVTDSYGVRLWRG